MAKMGKTDEKARTRLRLLGLTEAEASTLMALLKTDPSSVSDIAESSGVPRMAVHSALKRLSSRGLVRKLPDPYRSMWKVKNLGKIKNVAEEAVQYLEKENKEEAPDGKEIVGKIEAEDIGIEVFKGVRQVKRVYEETLTLSRAERVYFIQGNKSAEATLGVMDEEYLRSFHAKIKKRGIIVEGVAGEAVLKIFKKLNVPLLRSHMNRLLIGRVIPDEFADFNLDIFVFRNKAFFVSFEQKIVIALRFEPLVDALLKICAD